MKISILKILVLSLFTIALGACGTTENASRFEDQAGFSFGSDSEIEEFEGMLEEAPSEVVPVVVAVPPQSSLPPRPTPPTDIKVEIQHAMGQSRPGSYTFVPVIMGGVAPLDADWGCTSPDSKCPENWVQGISNGFSTITGEFLEGHYQIDLSVKDAEENKASASFSFEIVAAPPPNSPSNPVDLRTNFPSSLNLETAELSSTSTVIVQSGIQELSLLDVYQNPPAPTWTNGLAHISYLPALSSLSSYRSPFRTNLSDNRLEGEIRVRFPRRIRYEEVNRNGSFVEVAMINFFPTDWIRWDLKGCLTGGSCRTLQEDLNVEEIAGSPCDPEQNTHCEKTVTINLQEEDLPGGDLRAYEKFQISVSDTDEALFRYQNGNIQICSRQADCASSHPYCVAGVCSAIYPGTYLETN